MIIFLLGCSAVTEAKRAPRLLELKEVNLIDAIKLGDRGRVEELLCEGANPIKIEESGRNAVVIAMELGQYEIANNLVNYMKSKNLRFLSDQLRHKDAFCLAMDAGKRELAANIALISAGQFIEFGEKRSYLTLLRDEDSDMARILGINASLSDIENSGKLAIYAFESKMFAELKGLFLRYVALRRDISDETKRLEALSAQREELLAKVGVVMEVIRNSKICPFLSASLSKEAHKSDFEDSLTSRDKPIFFYLVLLGMKREFSEIMAHLDCSCYMDHRALKEKVIPSLLQELRAFGGNLLENLEEAKHSYTYMEEYTENGYANVDVSDENLRESIERMARARSARACPESPLQVMEFHLKNKNEEGFREEAKRLGAASTVVTALNMLSKSDLKENAGWISISKELAFNLLQKLFLEPSYRYQEVLEPSASTVFSSVVAAECKFCIQRGNRAGLERLVKRIEDPISLVELLNLASSGNSTNTRAFSAKLMSLAKSLANKIMNSLKGAPDLESSLTSKMSSDAKLMMERVAREAASKVG